MELKLWSPLTDLEREWRVAIPRFFGESGTEFRPSIDIVKLEGELVITAEFAGVDLKDVEVTLDESVRRAIAVCLTGPGQPVGFR